MKKLSIREYIIYSSVILSGVLIDQLSKWLATAYLKPIGDLPLIKGVLHFTYHMNPGMAFGLLANNRWIFMVFSTLMILVLGYLLYAGKLGTRLYNAAAAMIISGGIGNMIDRFFIGKVVDFINFELINFAVFNVADSIVCIGAGLLIFALILDIVKEHKQKRQENEK